MLTGSNLLHTKQFNLRIVHETIRLAGPLSRAAIARHTALTGQTVSNLVRQLLDRGLVVETARRSEGRGAPSTDLAINPEGAFAVGLDFNRDHLTGVLVDLAGTVRERAHTDLEFPTPREALDRMVEMTEALIGAHAIDRARVCGVGIGVPGLMHPAPDGHGYVVTPTAFPGWHDVPLARWVHERLGLSVLLGNNATAAAVGERRYGVGRQLDTFFYVFLGSGLGGAIIIDGRPYEGATGNAGEIGYLAPQLGAAAAPAHGADAVDHVGLHFNLPVLFDRLRADGVDVRTAAELAPLLEAGNPTLLAWLDTAVDHLTGLVLAVEYVLDPEAVIIGGRLPDPLLERLCHDVSRAVPARRVRGKTTTPRLLMATAGSDAAALGVATLPIDQCFAPAPQVLLKPNVRPSIPGPILPGLAALA